MSTVPKAAPTTSGAQRQPSAPALPPGVLRHVVGHLLVPLLMCVGMGLAYLGALSNEEVSS